MSRDLRLYLEDILQACEKIQRYTDRMFLDEFQSDDRTYDAVIRNLEIIGEAAKNIPPETRALYPDIEWRAIAAFRNIVAHEYFAVNAEIVWDIITNKIPDLQKQIEDTLAGF